MEALRKHRLVRLTGDGWASVLARVWDAPARHCLAHWAAHGLPLVVTRQSPGAGDLIALGLPAPTRWERRRIALHVPRGSVACFEEFPELGEVLPWLPQPARAAACRLQDGLGACGAQARIYGSYGSRLHQDRDGRFIGYAEWPDEATWQKAFDAKMVYDDPEVRRMFVEAIAEAPPNGEPLLAMTVTDDLLLRANNNDQRLAESQSM